MAADIIIPGTNKVLLDGTILIFADYGDTKYIVHNGYYTYNEVLSDGWYGVSIPDQNIIPVNVDMLLGCEVVYYPDTNYQCRFPNGNIPYTTQDKFELQRAFITVDTMEQRDALAPNLIPADLPDGKMVRVNKPDNVHFNPAYFTYVYDDLESAHWEHYEIYMIPEGGIPKSDLSEDVQASLDLADGSVQIEQLGTDFDIDSGIVKLSESGKVYTCVLNWLTVPIGGSSYPTEQVELNLVRLNTIRDLDKAYQTQWGRHLVYINISNKYYPSIIIRNSNNDIIGVQAIVYSQSSGRLDIYTIQGTTVANYTQTTDPMLEYRQFDAYSVQGASQFVIAQWIYSLVDVANGIAGLDANNLIGSSHLPIASAANLGAIKINQGGLEIGVDGTVSIIPGTDIEIDPITGAVNNTYTYELPIASAELLGGIKAGTWISIDQSTGVASVVIPAETFDAYGAASAVQGNLDTHTGNTTIHVTSQNKSDWNAKYDLPSGGIPKTDLSSAVQSSLGKADSSVQSVNTTIIPDASGNVFIGYQDVGADAAGTAASEAAVVQGNLDLVGARVEDIEELIPSAATTQNQLADKSFVNSSISTNTANFIGTFDSVQELEAYSGPLTNNDYAFVVEYDPEDPTIVVAYNRYKYNQPDQQWLFEYTLNNSSFTSEQWAAINSAITADLVTSYSNHIADTTIHVTSTDKTTWNAKYDKPSGGIPKSDLSSDVQTSLGKADTALQSAPVTSVNTKTGDVVLGKSDIGLGNVDNIQQYSATNPPPYPVTSVNTKTGVVTLTASDVGAYVKPASGIPASDLASDVDLVSNPSSATDGQLLTADGQGGYGWEDAPISLPSGGTSGQVLTKQSNADGDVDWDNIPTVAPIVGTLTLSSSSWIADQNETDVYKQEVTIAGSNTNSKVDIQQSSDVIDQMLTDGVKSLYIENDAGTLYAVAVGAEPSTDMTVQYQMVIVVSTGTSGQVTNLNDIVQTTGDILILNGGTSTSDLSDLYSNANGQSF